MTDIFIRNLDAKRAHAIPLGDGWCRVLRPAVTTAVPARVLALPSVRTLLDRQLLIRIDHASRDPEERRLRALAADMAAAIAKAEQAEIDKLRQGASIKPRRAPTGRPRYRWTAERIARFEKLWNARATPDEIACEMDMARQSIWHVASKLGLSRSTPRKQNGLGKSPRPSGDPEEIRTPEIAAAA